MTGTIQVTLGPLNLFGTDAFGVKWTLTPPLDGWGSTKPTISPVQKPRQHGAWAGNSYYGPRHLPATGLIRAPSQAALSAAIDRLNDACSLDDTTLTVAEDGRSRWCTVRREDEVLAPMLTPLIAKYSIQVIALDPRKMGAPLTGSTLLPSSSGGLVVPVVVPLTINSTVTSGQVSLFNPGNETGPVMASLVGPLIGPILTHVGSGLRLVFSASATIADGEFWDVDMEGHKVLAQGQANRSGWITSRQWSGFEPGNNTWSLSAVSATTGSVTITATPADQ
jgi:hypothetical protein